jgi:hypothetical protein
MGKPETFQKKQESSLKEELTIAQAIPGIAIKIRDLQAVTISVSFSVNNSHRTAEHTLSGVFEHKGMAVSHEGCVRNITFR